MIKKTIKNCNFFYIFLILLSIIFITFSIFSCQTTNNSPSSKADKGTSKDPVWINEIPKDENYYYFVGSGGPVNDQSEGEKIALGEIQSKVFLLIGANVTTYLENNQYYKSSQNKEEFINYLNSIVQVEGKGIISNFEIIDKYIKNTGTGGIIVYILARISKESVLKEQKRLEKIYEEKINSFLIPEQNGYNYLQSGFIYEAIFEFIKAAKNSFLSDYENRLLVSERNLDTILKIIKNFNAELTIPKTDLISNEKQYDPFTYKVTYTDQNTIIPVKNIPVKFFYKDINNNGEIITKEHKTNTNKLGLATFSYDKVPFSGESSIIAFLDIFDIIDDYIKTVTNQQNLKEKANIIRSSIANYKISKNFNIISKTINLSTMIYINFYDNSNTKIQNFNISNFLSNLTKLGIKFSKQINLKIERDNNIISLLSYNKEQFLINKIERVIIIIGETKSIKEYSGKQIASVEINAYIYIPSNDNTRIITLTSTGNSDTIILAILDAYQKALEKLYKILTMIL
jgi:hypothetical protein